MPKKGSHVAEPYDLRNPSQTARALRERKRRRQAILDGHPAQLPRQWKATLIGGQLRAYRRKHGWNIVDVHLKTKIPYESLAAYERAKSRPSYRRLKVLSELFGCPSVEEFVCGSTPCRISQKTFRQLRAKVKATAKDLYWQLKNPELAAKLDSHSTNT